MNKIWLLRVGCLLGKNISPNTLCFLNIHKLHPMNEQSNVKKMIDSYFICKMDQVQNYSILFVLSYSQGLCDLNLIFKSGLLHLWSLGKMGVEKLKFFNGNANKCCDVSLWLCLLVFTFTHVGGVGWPPFFLSLNPCILFDFLTSCLCSSFSFLICIFSTTYKCYSPSNHVCVSLGLDGINFYPSNCAHGQRLCCECQCFCLWSMFLCCL